MADYALRRTHMVDNQVRPSDVTSFPVIDAMLTVPRELYVPPARRETAYLGENIEIAPGRIVFDPRTLGKLLEALEVKSDDGVLLIGAGLGYSAAVLARMAGFVVAVEEDGDMAAQAQATLSEQGADNAAISTGSFTAGAPASAPFDVVIIEGAVEEIPEAIIAQVAEGGRIGTIFAEGMLGVARIGLKIDGRMAWRYAFNAHAPVLPGFERSRAFTF